jgi:hypothetical protein
MEVSAARSGQEAGWARAGLDAAKKTNMSLQGIERRFPGASA